MPQRNGADEQFEALVFDEHRGLVAASAMIVGDLAVAEEIVQDALERTYARWERVRRLDRPGAWVRRVVLNRSVSHLRRQGAERRALDRMWRRRPVEVADPDPDAGAVWAGVAKLPRNQANAVALHYGADLPLAAVAEELGLTESAVKALLLRARATLRSAHTTEEVAR